ncbi:hypothetical protein CISECK367B_08910 [Citrobacter sedlakii]
MNKRIISDINPNMMDVWFRFEKHQITDVKFILMYPTTDMTLLTGSPRQVFMNRRGNNTTRKGGAINATAAVPAPAVMCTLPLCEFTHNALFKLFVVTLS